MPTKRLPDNPVLKDFRHAAEVLLERHRGGHPDANQRIREFHPAYRTANDAGIGTSNFSLGDAQLVIAREYGLSGWERLLEVIQAPEALKLASPHHERITNSVFRRGVDFIDEGDTERLRAHLNEHPDLATRRVHFEGENYFTNPSLLEFIAENPIRHGALPPNIMDISRIILDAGAKSHQEMMDATLGLVSSGRIARECGAQIPLIDLLCDYNANPDSAMSAALGHGELDAVEALMRHKATVTLPVAAGTNRLEKARELLIESDPSERHLAVGIAAMYGHAGFLKILLDAGEDPNRYNPIDFNAHATPLHLAALAGHLDAVRVLVTAGAKSDLPDIHHQSTALGWARHGEHDDIVAFLQSQSGSSIGND